MSGQKKTGQPDQAVEDYVAKKPSPLAGVRDSPPATPLHHGNLRRLQNDQDGEVKGAREQTNP
jgi:hypothetical protein